METLSYEELFRPESKLERPKGVIAKVAHDIAETIHRRKEIVLEKVVLKQQLMRERRAMLARARQVSREARLERGIGRRATANA